MDLKIAYLSGPVDGREVWTSWNRSENFSFFGTSYMTHFFDVCEELKAKALVITTLPAETYTFECETVSIINRASPTGSGIKYHLQMAYWFISLIPVLIKFRPQFLITTVHQNYWFLLAPLRLFRVGIIPSLHCVLERPFFKEPLHVRILLSINGYFFRYCVKSAMAISDVAGEQIKKLAKRPNLDVRVICPTYDPAQFSKVAPPDFDTRPFRILFAGRVEANKGIFDLLEVASMLNEAEPGQFTLDICGEGTELAELQRRVLSLDLDKIMNIHGFCDRLSLSGILAASHVAVVPTRSEFEEGFAKSCAEAILADRPVITSAVCPALYTLRSAAIEVRPDSPRDYYQAIRTLASSKELFSEKVSACEPLKRQFFDIRRSYRETLLSIVKDRGLRASAALN